MKSVLTILAQDDIFGYAAQSFSEGKEYYLVEAREYAMDGGSSDEKHWWFGKYKGKINNYLSGRGYDLNQAGKDWQKRIEERKKSPDQ